MGNFIWPWSHSKRVEKRQEQLAVVVEVRQEGKKAVEEMRVRTRSLESAINELIRTNEERRRELRAD